MLLLSTLILSLFLTVALVPALIPLAGRLKAVDLPDDVRKVHSSPMPRIGGVAMALGIFVPIFLWVRDEQFARAVLIGGGIIFFFGFMDDIIHLGYKAKFAGQIAAASVVILYGGVKINCLGMLLPDNVILTGWLSIPLTLFVIVGVTNAINLSDGLDGLAGGICLLGFGCVGYLALQCDNFTVVLMCAAAVGAIFGFLRFNTRPASLFMGDAGSQCLGFLAATLSINLCQGNTPLNHLVPLLIWGFPILDTISVMLKRMVRGRPLFSPDRSHFHHDLIHFGLYHTEAVFVIYVLHAMLVTCAFLLRFHSEWLLLSSYIIFSGVILSSFFMAHKFHWTFKRYSMVDTVIKGRLKILKDKNILIKVSFKTIYWATPAIVLFSCLLPERIPKQVSFSTMAFLVIILSVRSLRKEWTAKVERFAVYLLVPFIVYLSETGMARWMDPNLVRLYNFSFAGIVAFVMLTVKFSRRRGGFKVTPMDFLIIFVALVVPNLPDPNLAGYHLGLIAAKIIVLYFTYEVLIAELRGELKALNMATIAALVVTSVRGFL